MILLSSGISKLDMSSAYLPSSQFGNRKDMSFPICAPFICWKKWHSSKTTPTLPSVPFRSCEPNRLIVPESTRFAPVMHLIRVVFPAPFSPIRPTT